MEFVWDSSSWASEARESSLVPAVFSESGFVWQPNKSSRQNRERAVYFISLAVGETKMQYTRQGLNGKSCGDCLNHDVYDSYEGHDLNHKITSITKITVQTNGLEA
jgi:hypothetical protein